MRRRETKSKGAEGNNGEDRREQERKKWNSEKEKGTRGNVCDGRKKNQQRKVS